MAGVVLLTSDSCVLAASRCCDSLCTNSAWATPRLSGCGLQGSALGPGSITAFSATDPRPGFPDPVPLRNPPRPPRRLVFFTLQGDQRQRSGHYPSSLSQRQSWDSSLGSPTLWPVLSSPGFPPPRDTGGHSGVCWSWLFLAQRSSPCTAHPNSTSSSLVLVPWNQQWWEYSRHRHGPTPQTRALFLGEQVSQDTTR